MGLKRVFWNNLRMAFSHPASLPLLAVFMLEHPSSLASVFRGPYYGDAALAAYRVKLVRLEAVRRYQKLYSSWGAIDLQAAKNLIEQELKHNIFDGWRSCGLYTLVRLMKPDIVVETGVATGHSSSHILQALHDNGRGTLYSIDLPNASWSGDDGNLYHDIIPGETGFVVPKELRDRWQLILGKTQEVLPGLLKQVGKVDIFLHDSEHTYKNMMFEFSAAYPYLKPGGLVFSDDVEMNGAFADFCVELKPKFCVAEYSGKKVGLAFKS